MPPAHFAFDSDVVDTQKYATELATIVVFVLKEFSDTDVEITGYTDHRGSNAHNDGLLPRRAEAVKKYLVEQVNQRRKACYSGARKRSQNFGTGSTYDMLAGWKYRGK